MNEDKQILATLAKRVDAMSYWARQEDGIPDFAVDAYCSAKLALKWALASEMDLAALAHIMGTGPTTKGQDLDRAEGLESPLPSYSDQVAEDSHVKSWNEGYEAALAGIANQNEVLAEARRVCEETAGYKGYGTAAVIQSTFAQRILSILKTKDDTAWKLQFLGTVYTVASPSDPVPTEVETSSVPVSGAVPQVGSIWRDVIDNDLVVVSTAAQCEYTDIPEGGIEYRGIEEANVIRGWCWLKDFHEQFTFVWAPPSQSAVDLVGTQQTEQEAQASTDGSFEEWWDIKGKYFDPYPDVDWQGKRRTFARKVYEAAQSPLPKQSEQVERSWEGLVLAYEGMSDVLRIITRQRFPQIKNQRVKITLLSQEGEGK